MTDSIQFGLWAILAMIVIVILVSGYVYTRNRSDGESGDMEHFDHEPTGGL